MNLIFIYGAPATGKLTVAKELAGFLGYKLHHNHMTIDLALSLFDFDNPNFLKLCQHINLDVFKVAKEARLPGLIFTFCYGGPLDDSFVDEVISLQNSGDLFFIHLSCSIDELKKRVVSDDRRAYRKVGDVAILMDALRHIDYAKDIQHPRHLPIDTTSLPSRDAARAILKHYNLKSHCAD